jgi:PmbA protein
MPGVIGPDEFERVAAAALEQPGIDGAEVLFLHQWGGLTRFAASHIHQSTAQEDTALRVRVAVGSRIGLAQTNDFSPEGAALAAKQAKEMADVVAPDELFPGFAPKAAVPERNAFDEHTASATPQRRAAAVAELVDQCSEGLQVAGAHETVALEVAVANTNGQICWAPSTQASLSAVVTGDENAAGFAESFAQQASEIDPVAVGERAAEKARMSRAPRPLEPGTYPIVLEPAAVSTLVGFLAYMGFGGKFLIEGRSCFSGKEGSQVAAPAISIFDDATDDDTLGMPFDFEGVPHRRVDLIRQGVFQGGVYDLRVGKQAGKPSTGHALPAFDEDGPLPLNMFMATGDASVQDMIAATERGVLVTRFHYTNIVNQMESSITGMTRDGTFLIEKGEIVGPVNNFRFTQSILRALEGATMVGKTSELASEFFFSASRVPALKLEAFHFSGRSDH